jgi:large subunit ribosomal protein L3
MAGHMGNAQVTVKGLKVFEVDKEKNLLLLLGSVPGPRGAILEIAKTGQDKKFALPKNEEEVEVAEEPKEPETEEVKEEKVEDEEVKTEETENEQISKSEEVKGEEDAK